MTEGKYVHNFGKTRFKTCLDTNMKNYLQIHDTILFPIYLLFVSEKMLFSQQKCRDQATITSVFVVLSRKEKFTKLLAL